MDGARTCPFCGGMAVRRRPALSGAKMGATIGGTGLSLEAGGSEESYLKCNGCTMEFVRADRDVDTILAGLRARRRIAAQIRHYYGEGVTVTDLLTGHVTAMARKANHYRSLASVSVSKKELIICFSYKNIRTFGSFVRKSDRSSGRRYYEFRELSMA